MTNPRTRSPQCTNPWCVPDTIECPDCIEHNGPTPYQLEQGYQAPIRTGDEYLTFRERLERELYGCVITGGWAPGHESLLRVRDHLDREAFIRILPHGSIEHTRPGLGGTTHPEWRRFSWENLRYRLFT